MRFFQDPRFYLAAFLLGNAVLVWRQAGFSERAKEGGRKREKRRQMSEQGASHLFHTQKPHAWTCQEALQLVAFSWKT